MRGSRIHRRSPGNCYCTRFESKKYETSIDKLIPKKQKTKTVNLSARRAEREREKLDGGGNTKAKNDRREGWWNNEYLIKYCKAVLSLV